MDNALIPSNQVFGGPDSIVRNVPVGFHRAKLDNSVIQKKIGPFLEFV
jgi:hypothetical protein